MKSSTNTKYHIYIWGSYHSSKIQGGQEVHEGQYVLPTKPTKQIMMDIYRASFLLRYPSYECVKLSLVKEDLNEYIYKSTFRPRYGDKRKYFTVIVRIQCDPIRK
jgi:hypothetical protein